MSTTKFNITPGLRKDHLVIIGREIKIGCHRFFYAKCDCGKEVRIAVESWKIKTKSPKSCGCKRIYAKNNLTHGQSKSRLHSIWSSMKNRCRYESCGRYQYYGARGITVCKEWDKSFDVFMNWALNNGYKDPLEIDRIDVNGNYTPENCRFADRKTQMRGTRMNVYETIDGETKCLSEWAEIHGVSYKTMHAAMKRKGMTAAEAIPYVKRKLNKK